jgi:hypothetical protein
VYLHHAAAATSVLATALHQLASNMAPEDYDSWSISCAETITGESCLATASSSISSVQGSAGGAVNTTAMLSFPVAGVYMVRGGQWGSL